MENGKGSQLSVKVREGKNTSLLTWFIELIGKFIKIDIYIMDTVNRIFFKDDCMG